MRTRRTVQTRPVDRSNIDHSHQGYRGLAILCLTTHVSGMESPRLLGSRMRMFPSVTALVGGVLLLAGCGGGGEDSGPHQWVEGQPLEFCDEWTKADVESLLEPPVRLYEYQEGIDMCTWESRAEVNAGGGSVANLDELRVIVSLGSERYDTLNNSARELVRFDGPQGDVVSADGAYMMLIDGNTYYVSVRHRDGWDDDYEAKVRKVILKYGNAYVGRYAD